VYILPEMAVVSAGGRNTVVLAVLVLVVVAAMGVFKVTVFGFDFFAGVVGVEEATIGEVVATGSVATVVVAVISSAAGAFCANAGVAARSVLSEMLAIKSSM
jgi:hypothetical protein